MDFPTTSSHFEDAIFEGNLLHEDFIELSNKINNKKDKALEFETNPVPPDKDELIRRIEDVTLKIIEDLSNDKSPVLKLRVTNWNNCNYENDIVNMKPVPEAQIGQVCFGVARSERKFTVIVYILSKIYRMLQSGGTCTKREMYYQNVPLFQNQKVVDSAIRDICSILDAPSWSLGVNATSKGLIAGDLTITTSDGKELICSNVGGIMLPQNVFGIQFIKSSAKFVLVIEKDATFQKLLNDEAPRKLGPCILITGKGFPDVSTRVMVKRLCKDLQIPIYALVDADPHGIEIMCTYRFGSLAMSHQSDYLAVPSIRWLGVQPSDVETLAVPMLPITVDDLSKLRTLRSRYYIQNNPELLKQIDIMVSTNCKAEIEGVDCLSNSYLTDVYLPSKIFHSDFI
ncbi:meiotic recombination protein SPO11-like [Ctenocephalides felis]|uniref:meiotic recombination protein SPO11-like n=1 Tax=Ctenocephalides felis TaxID=7515 RepID=UPI000E6E2C4A|nr:meiotic recombination protein SPO11-like [Ctenocephalides felis]